MSVLGLRKNFLNNVEKPFYVNVWQKPNGEFYVRITKRRVSSCFNNHIQIGYVNNHGHKLIDVIKQYIDIYIEK